MHASSYRHALVAGLSLFAFAFGCGPDEARQVPSSPVGAVAGKITSLKDGTALANVKVSVLHVDDQGAASQSTATTGADGTFAIGGLPAGTTYRVRYELQGFVPRFHDVEIPAAAGNYPQGNGVGEANIALAPATGGIAGRVIGSGGTAVSGVKLGIDLRGADFDFVAQATTDSSGNYAFTGLPGAPTGVPVTLVVQPYDEDGNGQADYGVLQINALSFPDVSTRTDIDLRDAAAQLTLLASDLDDGEHPATDKINLTFNRPVDPDRLSVGLTDVDTSRDVGVSALVTSGTDVIVTVSGGKLAVGTHYQLTVDARAANGSSGSFSRYFRAVAGSTGMLPAVTGLAVTPEEVDWTTNAFTLKWDRVAGASAYRVYARDNKANPAYVLVQTVGSSPSPQTTVTLPSEFDTFSGDALQTPFAFKTGVDFAVVAVNALGDASAPGTNSVHREDTTAGQILSVVQTDGADNSAGTAPKTFELRVTFNEYIDTDNLPTAQLPAGLLSTFEPDSTLLSGKFVLVVPPGVDASGPYTISGAFDSSGNPFPSFDGKLSAVTELIHNGGFETCDLTGWTPYISGYYYSSPVATSAKAASGTCSAQIGNLTGYTQSGSTGLYQNLTLPAAVSGITFSMKYQLYTNYPYCHDSLYCQLQTEYGSSLTTLVSTCYPNSTWQTATADITAYAGQNVRVLCYVYQDGSHVTGAYLDDVSVTVNP